MSRFPVCFTLIMVCAYGVKSQKNAIEVMTPAYIDSVSSQIKKLDDDNFKIVYVNRNIINKIKGADFAEKIISRWIDSGYMDSVLTKALKDSLNDVQWNRESKFISKKYNEYFAKRVTTGAKVRWYGFKKCGNKLATYIVKNINEFEGWSDSFLLANSAWDVFLNSSQKKELKIAAEWCKHILRTEPQNAPVLDTYANILYKLGEIEEALELERKALEIDPNHEVIKGNYEKMMQGLPTWN